MVNNRNNQERVFPSETILLINGIKTRVPASTITGIVIAIYFKR